MALLGQIWPDRWQSKRRGTQIEARPRNSNPGELWGRFDTPALRMSINSIASGGAAPQDRLLSVSEVATFLGISERHLDNLRHRKAIRFVKLGRVIRFRRAELDQDITGLTVAAKAR